MSSISNKITAVLLGILAISFAVFSYINYAFTEDELASAYNGTQQKVVGGASFYLRDF